MRRLIFAVVIALYVMPKAHAMDAASACLTAPVNCLFEGALCAVNACSACLHCCFCCTFCTTCCLGMCMEIINYYDSAYADYEVPLDAQHPRWCAACKNPDQAAAGLRLACGHTFDFLCWRRLGNQRSCPLCYKYALKDM